jgi:hypothetical protein
MKRKRVAYTVALASAAMAVAGVAYAALPYSGANDKTVEACYSTGGNVKVLTPAEPTCPKGYTPIEWNVTGPLGLQGLQGPPRGTGATGSGRTAGSCRSIGDEPRLHQLRRWAAVDRRGLGWAGGEPDAATR